jgi:hypothetical protein
MESIDATSPLHASMLPCCVILDPHPHAKGNPDVEKFVTLLSNLHSDEEPVAKPVILESVEVWYYPPDE